MKAWIVSALEWLALQTDNDIDDAIVRRVKGAMKLGVVWNVQFTCVSKQVRMLISKEPWEWSFTQTSPNPAISAQDPWYD